MHWLTCLVFLKLQLFNYGPFCTKGFIVPPAGLNLSKLGDLKTSTEQVRKLKFHTLLSFIYVVTIVKSLSNRISFPLT